ncbi:hypothetical protein C8Q80DRAFT_1120615 [Daedaleopsis nitida]|nr:hypothetical protein C8Q80DRAFT_1120615 [Daedaleopsis nitida]
MRFSTILSSALLVGLVAAAPTVPKEDYSMMSESSMMASASSSSMMAEQTMKSSDKSSQSSSSGGCNSSDCDKSSQSSSSGGCNSGDCGNMDASSSSKMMESTSTMMKDVTSTMMMESSSTMMEQSASTSMMMETSTADATSTSTAYGSGSTSWDSSGYNDCVQQCVASYGAPPATWTPTSTQSSSSDGQYHGSSGSGVTHTVIVAPTQGVLRYVPFAVNASVGDTVMFMWNAKNHTVTKGSALELCNKTSDNPFTTGIQSAPFTFTQVVNDTNPTFFFCNTPGHCQKGMFGMINPPSAYQATSQVMSTSISNSSDLAAMQAFTDTMTKDNDKAATWGSNIDVTQLPDWAQNVALENVLYTRSFLGANPETLKDNGFIDMSGDAPKMIPADMAPINNAVDSGTATESAAPNAATSAAPAASSPAASSPAAQNNGASSTVASSALLGAAAFAAAILAF